MGKAWMAKRKADSSTISARWLRVRDAAQYLRMSKSTLDGWRSNGVGPPYMKVGRMVLYDVHDLDAWIKAKKFKPTAEYAAAR